MNLDKRIFGSRWPAPGVRVGAAASTSQIFDFYFVFEIKHVTADHEGFLSSVRRGSRSRTKYSLKFARNEKDKIFRLLDTFSLAL